LRALVFIRCNLDGSHGIFFNTTTHVFLAPSKKNG